MKKGAARRFTHLVNLNLLATPLILVSFPARHLFEICRTLYLWFYLGSIEGLVMLQP